MAGSAQRLDPLQRGTDFRNPPRHDQLNRLAVKPGGTGTGGPGIVKQDKGAVHAQALLIGTGLRCKKLLAPNDT